MGDDFLEGRLSVSGLAPGKRVEIKKKCRGGTWRNLADVCGCLDSIMLI